MKETNKKHLFIGTVILSSICIVCVAIFVITHIYSFMHMEKEHIHDKAIVLFKESVKEDFQCRSKVLTEKLSIVNSPETNKDSITFKTDSLEIRTAVLSNRSLDEKMTDFLQSILAVKNPIHVHRLDTIFQQKLKEENIHIETAICLTDTVNHKNNSCTHFNTTSFIPLFTEPYQVSTIGISLKSYIKIPQYALIGRMPTLYWIALLGWLLFTSSIIYAWFSMRKKVPVLIKEKEQLHQGKIKEISAYVTRENTLQSQLTEKEKELETFKQIEKIKNNTDIHIFSSCLTFDKNSRILRYNGEIVKLTGQQQQLLVAFCNAPEYTCSINDLHAQVWKGAKVEENTIQQAISRLNMEFKKISDLQIIYIFKDSYRLNLSDE